MAIQISGCTVIDNNRVGCFSSLVVPISVTSFNPTDGATGVNPISTITISFNQLVIKGTGTITIRSGSAGGTILESIDVATSPKVDIVNGGSLTISTELTPSTSLYIVIPAGAVLGSSGNSSSVINTYNFTTGTPSLGSSVFGGSLICCASNVYWIAANSNTEICRNFNSTSDANTVAQSCTGCTGWFVPSRAQLQTYGPPNRQYWDAYTATCYWSSSEVYAGSPQGWAVDMNLATSNCTFVPKGNSIPVRSFRCVTY